MLVKRTIAFVGALSMLLTACVSSHVMIGNARPPISPDMVKIYFQPPKAKYERIALLDTSSRNSFTFSAQGKMDKVIERLKEQAAKLGANGVLLEGVGDQAVGSVGSGFGQAAAYGNSAWGSGVGFSGTVFQKAGSGIAIYVEPSSATANK